MKLTASGFGLGGRTLSKTTDEITQIIRKPIEDLGYYLVDVEYKKEASTGWVLTLIIDKDGGVDLDDCERVSRAAEPYLDEADPIPGAYCLSVSSPGLDRPLKTDADFKRKLHSKVVVNLYAPYQGKKKYTGELSAFDAESITVTECGEIRILRKDIAVVKPYIEF
jgi:ribosome maturation factor RimP